MLASVSIREARDKRETRHLRDEKCGRGCFAFVSHFPKNLAKLHVSLLMQLVSVHSACLVFLILFPFVVREDLRSFVRCRTARSD